MLDDQDRQAFADAAHQLHRVTGLSRGSCRRSVVETEELGLGGERDADLQIALLAMREIGGQFVGLAAQANRFQHRFRLVMRSGRRCDV